jgi:CBS domain-containing protein
MEPTMNAGNHNAWQLPAARGTPVERRRHIGAESPGIGIDDSAVCVVSDSMLQTLWTISEDCWLDEALDKMSRLGVRAFLVSRERHVIGLISYEDIKRERATYCGANRVLDVMTDAGRIPMIEWQTVLSATVGDMLRILEDSHANHLLVVETDNSALARVRGLVYHRQLIRELGVFPMLDRGMESALAHFAARANESRAETSRISSVRRHSG